MYSPGARFGWLAEYSAHVKDFIDLQGASGASYRFRLWPEGRAHQPIAGNYVCVRAHPAAPGGYDVVHVGESTDLSQVRSELPKHLRGGGVGVYTRLNVARTLRTAEHEDLVAQYGPSQRKPRRAKTA
jgi:hypothetical protein